MKRFRGTATAMAGVILLAGCATQPMGPQVAVMPGPGKSFDAFQQDQAVCKEFANGQVAGEAQSANNQAIGGAVLGTVLGAGLGAAIGGGRGAGIGAAGGAALGTGVGASSSSHSEGGIQRQYDIAYSQCMASKGNQVPQYRPAPAPVVVYPPPPPAYYAPPTVYYPPPPPPTVVYPP